MCLLRDRSSHCRLGSEVAGDGENGRDGDRQLIHSTATQVPDAHVPLNTTVLLCQPRARRRAASDARWPAAATPLHFAGRRPPTPPARRRPLPLPSVAKRRTKREERKETRRKRKRRCVGPIFFPFSLTCELHNFFSFYFVD